MDDANMWKDNHQAEESIPASSGPAAADGASGVPAVVANVGPDRGPTPAANPISAANPTSAANRLAGFHNGQSHELSALGHQNTASNYGQQQYDQNPHPYNFQLGVQGVTPPSVSGPRRGHDDQEEIRTAFTYDGQPAIRQHGHARVRVPGTVIDHPEPFRHREGQGDVGYGQLPYQQPSYQQSQYQPGFQPGQPDHNRPDNRDQHFAGRQAQYGPQYGQDEDGNDIYHPLSGRDAIMGYDIAPFQNAGPAQGAGQPPPPYYYHPAPINPSLSASGTFAPHQHLAPGGQRPLPPLHVPQPPPFQPVAPYHPAAPIAPMAPVAAPAPRAPRGRRAPRTSRLPGTSRSKAPPERPEGADPSDPHPWKCQFAGCTRAFGSKYSLDTHHSADHNTGTEKYQRKQEVPGGVGCPIPGCGYETNRHCNVDKHLGKKHPEEWARIKADRAAARAPAAAAPAPTTTTTAQTAPTAVMSAPPMPAAPLLPAAPLMPAAAAAALTPAVDAHTAPVAATAALARAQNDQNQYPYQYPYQYQAQDNDNAEEEDRENENDRNGEQH